MPLVVIHPRRAPTPRRRQAVTRAILASVLLLGCASGPSPVPAALEPGTPDAPREINVIMRDYLFEPDPIRLVPGETVRFNIVNAGLLAHEFVLGDAEVQAAWASAEAAATPPGFTATPPPVTVAPEVAGLRVFLESGGSTAVDYSVPLGEQLELACQIPGHVEEGMVGTVELVDAVDPEADGP